MYKNSFKILKKIQVAKGLMGQYSPSHFFKLNDFNIIIPWCMGTSKPAKCYISLKNIYSFFLSVILIVGFSQNNFYF